MPKLKDESLNDSIINYIASHSGPVKVDDLAMEFSVDRRTMQNYIHDIKMVDPHVVSITGKNGGVLYSR